MPGMVVPLTGEREQLLASPAEPRYRLRLRMELWPAAAR